MEWYWKFFERIGDCALRKMPACECLAPQVSAGDVTGFYGNIWGWGGNGAGNLLFKGGAVKTGGSTRHARPLK